MDKNHGLRLEGHSRLRKPYRNQLESNDEQNHLATEAQLTEGWEIDDPFLVDLEWILYVGDSS